jgi:hypothetical protein
MTTTVRCCGGAVLDVFQPALDGWSSMAASWQQRGQLTMSSTRGRTRYVGEVVGGGDTDTNGDVDIVACMDESALAHECSVEHPNFSTKNSYI